MASKEAEYAGGRITVARPLAVRRAATARVVTSEEPSQLLAATIGRLLTVGRCLLTAIGRLLTVGGPLAVRRKRIREPHERDIGSVNTDDRLWEAIIGSVGLITAARLLLAPTVGRWLTTAIGRWLTVAIGRWLTTANGR